MKNKLAELRQKKEMTVTELAEKCDVSRQTIHSIENGTYKPSVVLAMKVARVFDLSVEDVFVLEKGD